MNRLIPIAVLALINSKAHASKLRATLQSSNTAQASTESYTFATAHNDATAHNEDDFTWFDPNPPRTTYAPRIHAIKPVQNPPSQVQTGTHSCKFKAVFHMENTTLAMCQAYVKNRSSTYSKYFTFNHDSGNCVTCCDRDSLYTPTTPDDLDQPMYSTEVESNSNPGPVLKAEGQYCGDNSGEGGSFRGTLLQAQEWTKANTQCSRFFIWRSSIGYTRCCLDDSTALTNSVDSDGISIYEIASSSNLTRRFGNKRDGPNFTSDHQNKGELTEIIITSGRNSRNSKPWVISSIQPITTTGKSPLHGKIGSQTYPDSIDTKDVCITSATVYEGRLIDGIQFYGKQRSDGETWESGFYGKTGGKKSYHNWGDDNCLTGFETTSGAQLDSLKFIYQGPRTNVQVQLVNPQQSSSWRGYPAQNAIDGDVTSIMHTLNNSGIKWWMAEFETMNNSPFTVSSVEILNRGGCCGERLAGATVKIGADNKVCGILPQVTNVGELYTIKCEQQINTGDTIKVYGMNDYLHFAEIRVFGTYKEPNADYQIVCDDGAPHICREV